MLDLNHALSESRKLHFFFCLSSFQSLQFTHLISPIRSISQGSCLENNVLLLIESKLVSFFVCFISSLYGCLSPSVPRFMLCIVVLWICPLIMLNKVVHCTPPSPKTAKYLLSIPYYLLIWHKYMHAEQRKTSEDTGTLPSNAISD